jgi:chromosome segregation ATPase
VLYLEEKLAELKAKLDTAEDVKKDLQHAIDVAIADAREMRAERNEALGRAEALRSEIKHLEADTRKVLEAAAKEPDPALAEAWSAYKKSDRWAWDGDGLIEAVRKHCEGGR